MLPMLEMGDGCCPAITAAGPGRCPCRWIRRASAAHAIALHANTGTLHLRSCCSMLANYINISYSSTYCCITQGLFNHPTRALLRENRICAFVPIPSSSHANHCRHGLSRTFLDHLVSPYAPYLVPFLMKIDEITSTSVHSILRLQVP
jgi:hypothetical protein